MRDRLMYTEDLGEAEPLRKRAGAREDALLIHHKHDAEAVRDSTPGSTVLWSVNEAK